MANFLRENCDQIKTIVVKTKGTPTQKLLVILMLAGIDKTADLAAMTGLSERAIQIAKRSLEGETHCAEAKPVSAKPIAVAKPISHQPETSFAEAKSVSVARVEDNNIYSNLETTVVSEVKESKGEVPSTADRGPSPAQAVVAFESYNRLALTCGLPQARSLTPGRRKLMIARLREHGMDGWNTALANVATSSFLKGRNDRHWRADLDFLLTASKLPKVIEGAYDDRKAPAAAADDKTDMAAAIARRLARNAQQQEAARG